MCQAHTSLGGECPLPEHRCPIAAGRPGACRAQAGDTSCSRGRRDQSAPGAVLFPSPHKQDSGTGLHRSLPAQLFHGAGNAPKTARSSVPAQSTCSSPAFPGVKGPGSPSLGSAWSDPCSQAPAERWGWAVPALGNGSRVRHPELGPALLPSPTAGCSPTARRLQQGKDKGWIRTIPCRCQSPPSP